MADQNGQISGAIPLDSDMTGDLTKVISTFFEEAKEILEDLDGLILKLEQDPQNTSHLNALFRRVHTLKGSVGAIPGGQLLGSLSHEFENVLGRLKREKIPLTKETVNLFFISAGLLKRMAETLRLNGDLPQELLSEAIEMIEKYSTFNIEEGTQLVAKQKKERTQVVDFNDEDGVWLSQRQVQELMRVSGELLILKNYFQMMQASVDARTQPELFERRRIEFTQNLNKVSDQLNSQILLVRKSRADVSLESLPVLIRQTSAELNKDVNLTTSGMDTLIDKSMGQDIYDCLVHMVRNSMDHGIEDQFDRATIGKPPVGTIDLHIYEKNGIVYFQFSDDGRGLNRERIRQKAVQSGLVDEDVSYKLSDDQIFHFIFKAGFSTKEQVSKVSGRGVGMDVVQNVVDKYSGKIHIESIEGKGTKFLIELPVPQNIMVESTLLCVWNNFKLAIPLANVAHITTCNELRINEVNHLRYVQFENLTIPLLTYQEILDYKINKKIELKGHFSTVFIRCKEGIVALLVEQVERQMDLVVKPFDRIIKGIRGFKGITVLADENVAYVIDPVELIHVLAQQGRPETMKEAA